MVEQTNQTQQPKKPEGKAVWIVGLTTRNDKNGNPFLVVTDQDGEEWFCFKNITDNSVKLEINKAYDFKFEFDAKGYRRLLTIEPLINKLKAKVAKDIADINTAKRDLGIAMRYSVDLTIAKVITPESMFDKAYEIYEWIDGRANEIINKSQK